MINTLVFPGTFDPITLGHVDLVTRATKLCTQVIVAVAASSRKQPLFTHAERIQLAEAALTGLGNIKVIGFDGLLVEFMRQLKAQVVLRGLRGVNDLEYEVQLANTNRRLYPELETLFLTPTEAHYFTTSSLVREVVSFGGDVEQFVPAVVNQALQHKFGSVIS